MFNKKAVEMSLNTVVIAAIVILIFIVLIYIVGSKLGEFTTNMNKCAKPNEKRDEGVCLSSGGVVIHPKYYGPNGDKLEEGSVCCSK